MARLPKKNTYDILYELVQGGLGAIPVVGSPIAAVFTMAVSKPVAKKRDAFLEALAEELTSLRHDAASIKDFIDKDEFVPSLIQGVSISLETNSHEKLQALRNAILNSVLVSPEEEKRQRFFNNLRSFSYGHITILKFLNDPYSFAKERGEDYQELSGGGSTTLSLTRIFPEYGDEFIKLIMQDLANEGTIKTIVESLTVNTGGTHFNSLTGYGKDFLEFIKNPETTNA